jgi:hypothetical protein
VPHPRLTRGEALRTRAEQITNESANAYLDEEPTVRKIPLPGKKMPVQVPNKALTLNH